MDQAWDGACGPRPSTASVQVRELSSQSLHNPQPRSKAPGHCEHGHSGQLAEECLSPARLQALAQEDDLQLVSMLEMCVNTRENSLGSFGLHLPNLSQLKLNGSCLGSLRDLGTSLGHLQVLWLARCGLADLDGISSFPALKELYVSYNDIWDLSPLCLLEHLEVLDLEGNCVGDLGQLRYLQLCPRLATLTLEGNPLCLRPGPGPTHQVPRGYNYRAEVRKLIPQLQVLDELPAAHTGLPASWKLDQDWLLVKEAIKEGCILDSLLPGTDRTHGSPMWSLSPQLCLPETQPRAPRRWPLSLLVPGVPLPEGLLPKGPAPEDDASNLTHGTGRVLCGNPTKGLQERRHQCQAGVHPEKLPPPRLEELAPRASAPGPDPADDRDLLVCAGLQALRELHLRWVPPTPHPRPATLCALIRGGWWLGPALPELLLVPGGWRVGSQEPKAGGPAPSHTPLGSAPKEELAAASPAHTPAPFPVGAQSPGKRGPQPPGAHRRALKSKRTRPGPSLTAAPQAWPQSLPGPRGTT